MAGKFKKMLEKSREKREKKAEVKATKQIKKTAKRINDYYEKIGNPRRMKAEALMGKHDVEFASERLVKFEKEMKEADKKYKEIKKLHSSLGVKTGKKLKNLYLDAQGDPKKVKAELERMKKNILENNPELKDKIKPKSKIPVKTNKGVSDWFLKNMNIKRKSKAQKDMDFLKKNKPFYASDKKAKEILDRHVANVSESLDKQGKSQELANFQLNYFTAVNERDFEKAMELIRPYKNIPAPEKNKLKKYFEERDGVVLKNLKETFSKESYKEDWARIKKIYKDDWQRLKEKHEEGKLNKKDSVLFEKLKEKLGETWEREKWVHKEVAKKFGKGVMEEFKKLVSKSDKGKLTKKEKIRLEDIKEKLKQEFPDAFETKTYKKGKKFAEEVNERIKDPSDEPGFWKKNFGKEAYKEDWARLKEEYKEDRDTKKHLRDLRKAGHKFGTPLNLVPIRSEKASKLLEEYTAGEIKAKEKKGLFSKVKLKGKGINFGGSIGNVDYLKIAFFLFALFTFFALIAAIF